MKPYIVFTFVLFLLFLPTARASIINGVTNPTHWYELDNNGIDMMGTLNLTENGAPTYSTSNEYKVNGTHAVKFDTAGGETLSGTGFPHEYSNFSFSAWINHTGFGQNFNNVFSMKQTITNGGIYMFLLNNGDGYPTTLGIDVTNTSGVAPRLTYTYNISEINQSITQVGFTVRELDQPDPGDPGEVALYVNGVKVDNTSFEYIIRLAGSLYLGANWAGNTNYWNGSIDTVQIWTDYELTPTEMMNIYNEFSPFQKHELTITVNDSETMNTINNFSVTVQNDAQQTITNTTTTGNVRFFVDKSYNTVNVTDVDNGTYSNQSLIIRLVSDREIQINATSTKTFLNVTPLNRTDNTQLDFNVTFNGNLNYTWTGITKSAIFLVDTDNYTIKINTSIGTANFTYETSRHDQNLTINLPNMTIIQQPPTNSYQTHTLTFNITLPTNDAQQYGTINLNFNGTIYNTTQTINKGTTTTYTVQFDTPNAIQTDTYNWTFNQHVSESYNVTVLPIQFTACTLPDAQGNITVNLTIFNEQNTSQTLSASVQTEFSLWKDNRDRAFTKTFDLSGNYNYLFCITPRNQSIRTDATILYTTTNGFTQRWFLQKVNLTNTTIRHVHAYNFNSVTGISDLKMEVRNEEDYDPLLNVYVDLQRQYIPQGEWITTQMDKTGDFGVAFFNIIEEGVNYRLLFTTENRTTLEQTKSLKFVCSSGLCEITYLLSLLTGQAGNVPIRIATSYDNSTKVVTINYNDMLGAASEIYVEVTKDTFSTHTTICSTTTTTTTGTFLCDTTNYNPPFWIRVGKKASPEDWVYSEEIKGTGGSLRDVIGGTVPAAFYTGIIVLSTGVLGASLGAIPAMVGLLTGLLIISLLGILPFVSTMLLLVVGIGTAIIVAKTGQTK